ncbi:MAG: response regulator [Desulfobacula sp.]|nr:response regulator [Desulfobacula sp.]
MSIKILIVDDETDLSWIIKDYLEDETDFKVHLAVSGEEGLEFLNKFQFDVCIVDMRLPKMNGNDFILKAHTKLPHGKFIIHTGSIDYSIPAQLSQIGMTDECILYKPVMDLSEFSNRIHELLKL